MMLDHPAALTIEAAPSQVESDLRERLGRQLRLQPGPVEVRRLFEAIAEQYERDLETKVEQAERRGDEALADALDRLQREVLPDVVERMRASLLR